MNLREDVSAVVHELRGGLGTARLLVTSTGEDSPDARLDKAAAAIHRVGQALAVLPPLVSLAESAGAEPTPVDIADSVGLDRPLVVLAHPSLADGLGTLRRLGGDVETTPGDRRVTVAGPADGVAAVLAGAMGATVEGGRFSLEVPTA